MPQGAHRTIEELFLRKRTVNRILCRALIWKGFGFPILDGGEWHGSSIAALESVFKCGVGFGAGCGRGVVAVHGEANVGGGMSWRGLGSSA